MKPIAWISQLGLESTPTPRHGKKKSHSARYFVFFFRRVIESNFTFCFTRNFVFSTVLTAFNYNESFDNLIKLMCDGDIFSHRIPSELVLKGLGTSGERELNFWGFCSNLKVRSIFIYSSSSKRFKFLQNSKPPRRKKNFYHVLQSF